MLLVERIIPTRIMAGSLKCLGSWQSNAAESARVMKTQTAHACFPNCLDFWTLFIRGSNEVYPSFPCPNQFQDYKFWGLGGRVGKPLPSLPLFHLSTFYQFFGAMRSNSNPSGRTKSLYRVCISTPLTLRVNPAALSNLFVSISSVLLPRLRSSNSNL